MKIRTYQSDRLARRASKLAGSFVAAIRNDEFHCAQGVVDSIPAFFTDEALPVATAEIMYEVIRLTAIGSNASTIFISGIADTMCEIETGDR